MLLRQVVDCSVGVRSTRSRLAKTAAVAELLALAPSSEVPLVIAYLSGELPQGKIGVGYSMIHAVATVPAKQRPTRWIRSERSSAIRDTAKVLWTPESV